jgi:hypothetical protein
MSTLRALPTRLAHALRGRWHAVISGHQLSHGTASPPEDRPVPLQDERGVRGGEQRLQLEGELRGIEVGAELAELLRLARRRSRMVRPLCPLRRDRIAHGTVVLF